MTCDVRTAQINSRFALLVLCFEKRRRIRRLESDGDGGAGEKKERKTKAEVVGQHQERLVGERIVKGGHARPS